MFFGGCSAPSSDASGVDDAISKLQAEPLTGAPHVEVCRAESGPAPEESGDAPGSSVPLPGQIPAGDQSGAEFLAELRQLIQPLQRAQQAFIEFKKQDPATGAIRVRYDDAALAELARRASEVEAQAEAFAPAFQALANRYAPGLAAVTDANLKARIDALRALSFTAGPADLRDEGLRTLFGLFGEQRDTSFALFPFALQPLLPRPGFELAALTRSSSPFPAARAAWANYNGDAAALVSRFELYRQQRDLDNPKPASVFENQLTLDAVPVAFLDSGLDFVRFPELGTFLGESYDYADNDSNPWLPALSGGLFTHGTGTTKTLLSLIAKNAPEALRDQRIEIRMWKTQTIRQLLSRYAGPQGISADDPSWENRPAIHDSVFSEILLPSYGETRPPKVLVAPMGIQLRDRIFNGGYPEDFLAQAPWFWVMAAGNSGTDPRLAKPSPCLLDLPYSYRPRDSMLCVGAARMGPRSPGTRTAAPPSTSTRSNPTRPSVRAAPPAPRPRSARRWPC